MFLNEKMTFKSVINMKIKYYICYVPTYTKVQISTINEYSVSGLIKSTDQITTLSLINSMPLKVKN